MCTLVFCSLKHILNMFPSESIVKGQSMFDFKKIRITFSILKLQKCDAYRNGVEFRHKPNGSDVKWLPPLVLLKPAPSPLKVYFRQDNSS